MLLTRESETTPVMAVPIYISKKKEDKEINNDGAEMMEQIENMVKLEKMIFGVIAASSCLIAMLQGLMFIVDSEVRIHLIVLTVIASCLLITSIM